MYTPVVNGIRIDVFVVVQATFRLELLSFVLEPDRRGVSHDGLSEVYPAGTSLGIGLSAGGAESVVGKGFCRPLKGTH